MPLQNNYIFPFTDQTLERSLPELDDLSLFMCSGLLKTIQKFPLQFIAKTSVHIKHFLTSSSFSLMFCTNDCNCWPQRGGSAIKRFKTTKRGRLTGDILNALVHVSINGPLFGTGI